MEENLQMDGCYQVCTSGLSPCFAEATRYNISTTCTQGASYDVFWVGPDFLHFSITNTKYNIKEEP